MEVMVAISKAAEARDGGRRTVATRDENGYVPATCDFNFGRFGPAVLVPNFFNWHRAHAALPSFSAARRKLELTEEGTTGVPVKHAAGGIG
jgi:hypothetical protein